MDLEKKQMVVEHAMLTEKNFLLAAAVANSFEEIMKSAVAGLFEEIKQRLDRRLDSAWEYETSLDFEETEVFGSLYFCICKKDWISDDEKYLYMIKFQMKNKFVNCNSKLNKIYNL